MHDGGAEEAALVRRISGQHAGARAPIPAQGAGAGRYGRQAWRAARRAGKAPAQKGVRAWRARAGLDCALRARVHGELDGTVFKGGRGGKGGREAGNDDQGH